MIAIIDGDVEVVLRQIVLHLAQPQLNFGAKLCLRILLQENFQSLFSFARMRDIAIRKTHLAHLGLRHFHHGCVGELIGWEKG